MKKLTAFLVLIASMVISQSVFGQTVQEKKQMGLIEGEISRLESEIRALEKEEARQKAQDKLELRRLIRDLELRADPRRAKSEEDMLLARTKMNNFWLQIDSLDATVESFEISLKREELDRFLKERQAMIGRWTSPGNTVPREMGVITKNRRLRANVVRREELGLAKAENLINNPYQDQKKEGSQEKNGHPLVNERGEQKVVLDNKTYSLATFKFLGQNGGEQKTFTLAARTKERHYLIPDVYKVEMYHAGRFIKAGIITLDGRGGSYEGEQTMGHAFLSPSF